MIELTEQECAYVLELLTNAHTELLHELHHTVTRKFEEALRQQVTVNEELSRKLGGVVSNVLGLRAS